MIERGEAFFDQLATQREFQPSQFFSLLCVQRWSGTEKLQLLHQIVIHRKEAHTLGQRNALDSELMAWKGCRLELCKELKFHCLPHCDKDFIVLQAHGDRIAELPEQTRLRVVEGRHREQNRG